MKIHCFGVLTTAAFFCAVAVAAADEKPLSVPPSTTSPMPVTELPPVAPSDDSAEFDYEAGDTDIDALEEDLSRGEDDKLE